MTQRQKRNKKLLRAQFQVLKVHEKHPNNQAKCLKWEIVVKINLF